MAKPRTAIEARFRRGSNAFILIGLISAIGNTLLYHGFVHKSISMFCLAIPVVLDTVVRVVDPRLWGQELHYYCYVFGMILSAVFLLLGLLSKATSHTGTVLKLSSWLRPLAGLARFLGMAQLVGSRLFYFVGIVLYVFDGLLALVMENVLRAHFTELRMVILGNLAFHCVLLIHLLYGFVNGMEREVPAAPTKGEGLPVSP
jgi:hypothetical protein